MRRGAGLVTIVTAVSLGIAPASAVSRATVNGTQAAGAGKWSAVLRLPAATNTTGGLTQAFTWSTGNRNVTTYVAMDLANVGNLNLLGSRITIPQGTLAANWSAGGTPTANITLRLCAGGTWTISGAGGSTATCSAGTAAITSLSLSAGGTSCANLSAACDFILTRTLVPAAEAALVMGMTSGVAGTYTLTASARVDRTRVRAASNRQG